MHLTIITYRENGADYCMGQCMDRSGSALQITHTTDIVEAAESIGRCLFENKIKNREYYDYEIFILQNGNGPDEYRCFDNDEDYDYKLTQRIMDMAEINTNERMEVHNKKEAERQHQKEEAERKRKEEVERKQYETLKQKFE